MPDEYPNNPAEFMENPERKDQEDVENSKITASLPIAQDTIDWLDAWANSMNLDNLAILPGYTDKSTIVEVHVAKRMRAQILSKANEYQLKYGSQLEQQ